MDYTKRKKREEKKKQKCNKMDYWEIHDRLLLFWFIIKTLNVLERFENTFFEIIIEL